jgi:hypothetical protein
MKVGPRGVLCFFLGIIMVMYSGIHPVTSLATLGSWFGGTWDRGGGSGSGGGAL